MKSGKLPRKTSRRNQFVTFYFIVGSMMLLVFFILYSNMLLRDIRKDVEIVPDLYSKFLGLPADVNLEHFLFQYFMEEIIPNIDYPIILTDSLKTPFSWENIDIEQNKEYSELDERQQKILLNMLNKMEANNMVIPLKFNKDDEKIYSYVYYGDSETMTRLKMMPYIDMTLIIVFVLLGIYGIFTLKKREKDLLWVGLAKETAHQFGTPLSSLGGWLDVMESKLQDKDDVEKLEMLSYMKNDVKRLSKIASRFGKVGSVIKHQNCNLHDLIEETVLQFQRRLPTESRKIDLTFDSSIEGKQINIDSDLITWTLENLIKNALDAMQNKSGKITVKAFEKNEKIYIHISDEGIGLAKSMYKKIFLPGTTSKARGWGLGLSLAHRIVEEYHHGKIRVLQSEVGKGTSLEVVLG